MIELKELMAGGGIYLRQMRQKNGIRLKAMADEMGMSSQNLRNCESRKGITLDTAERYIQALEKLTTK
jgi:DNA-binding Xre family transcriptional regulator